MATEDEVMKRGREMIVEQAKIDSLPVPENLGPDTVLDDEEGVDSLGFIYVLTKLEGEFNAIVPDDEWWKIHTLRDLAHAIVTHQQ